MAPTPDYAPFTLRERLVFAAADLWGGGGQTIVSLLYLVFLTNVLGVRPGLAGTALLLVRVWDAVIDPIIGVVVDNTRTRWGRRRPYLFFGGIGLLVVWAAFWLPVRFDSSAAQFAFIVITNVGMATVGSFVAIAYSSLSTEITTDFAERNKANVTRLVFSLAATAVCSLLPTIFFNKLDDGTLPLWGFYLVIVLGFGVVLTGPIVLAGWVCRERAPYDQGKARIDWGALARPLKLISFRKLIALYLTQTMTMDTVSAVVIYYSLYVVAGVNSTVFLGVFLGIELLIFPVLYKLVNRVSKTKLFGFGLPVAILGATGIAFYPSDGGALGVYIVTGVTALGFAGALTLSWIIYPDVVDIGDLAFGKRTAGSFGAALPFIRQVSSAVNIFVIGQVLEWSGFVNPTDEVPEPAQPSSTVWALRLVILFSFLLFCGMGLVVSRGFHLTPQLAERVKHFIDVRESDGLESLGADEKAELDAILDEFAWHDKPAGPPTRLAEPLEVKYTKEDDG
jgi:GPH family glycoside/pentoside/hexuronide:cation symporter/oligogalacturonide transporter